MAVLTDAELVQTATVVHVVVRYYAWDKDKYIHAYLSQDEARAHAARLNGEPYDPEDPGKHRVWTIPFGHPDAVPVEDGS